MNKKNNEMPVLWMNMTHLNVTAFSLTLDTVTILIQAFYFFFPADALSHFPHKSF